MKSIPLQKAINQSLSTLEQQLQNFASALSAAMKTKVPIAKPNSWLDAFAMLRKHLESKNKKVRQVIFF